MRKTLLGLAMLIIIAGCKKEEPITAQDPTQFTEVEILGPVTLNNYPLKEGNAWTYAAKYHGMADSIRYFTYRCTAPTNSAGIDFYKMELTENSPYHKSPLRHDFTSYYFTANPQGLYASRTPSLDSPTTNTLDACILKYGMPLNAGWQTEKPFASQRIPVNYVRVTTAAGTFDCIKLKVEYSDYHTPYFYNTIQYLYFSDKGLVITTQISDEKNITNMVLTSTNF